MRRWLFRGVVAAAVWAALLGYAALDDRQPHPVGLAAAVTAVLAVVWLCTDAYEVAEPPQWALYQSISPDRTFDPRFSRLSQEIAEASDRKAASRAVHQSLSQVADKILLERYGVNRGVDPDAAREVLGGPTSAFLGVDPEDDARVFSPALSDVLTRLESL